jgi:hypothetical protein
MFEVLSAEWQFFLAMSGFVGFWLIESVAPFSSRTGRVRHAARNLAIAGVNVVALALLLSGLTVGVAHAAETRSWGILNKVPLSPFANVLLAVLTLAVDILVALGKSLDSLSLALSSYAPQ